jgi:hypothetical protein
MSDLPPILLTSSVIAMDQSVNLKDEKLRIHYTLESIGKWLEICPNVQLVLCDGSGFNFSLLVNEQFPKATIECLYFDNDPHFIRLHGKGYGEGEIIRYAIENSKILHDSTWFAKCTAKLWVDNFMDCIQAWNGRLLCQAFFSNVFSFRKTLLKYVDTRFYLIDKNFYIKNFLNAHIGIGGTNGISIEDKFLEVIQGNNLKEIFFPIPPAVSGVGGGSGRYYKNSIIRRLKERVRALLVSMRPEYRELFSK